jgi:uncharacterized circularly permuted ATP-grasp superfamily protein
MNYFNEALDQEGKTFPHYAEVFELWRRLSRRKRIELHRQSKQLFSGDYPQSSLPRILTQIEFQILEKGVDQRARAILAFLQDYVSKGIRWRRVVPAGVLKSVIFRHHAENYLKNIKPEGISFPYGPDIIRDNNGKWRVLEDSAGIIGGIGDLCQSQKVLFKLIPKLKNTLTSNTSGFNNPMDFFEKLAIYFWKKAAKNNGIPVLYLRAFSDETDNETRRLAQIFEKFDIPYATVDHRTRKLETVAGVLSEQG